MTADEVKNNPPHRPITLRPCLVLVLSLIFYGIMLNHWVTLSSLPIISSITGWNWHIFPLPWRQTMVPPLYLVLTSPVRILPEHLRPIALNAFAALCGALALALLAASVRLLPHDRTREQRLREGGEFSLLSVRGAFLPALFAVLMMGLQLTFWKDAVAASMDILDVMVFAFLIYCLLKFRVSQNDKWLYGFAFSYALGMANNWALLGFLPLFFIALIWIKGIGFFSWRFLARLAVCAALGLLLYLLNPALGARHHWQDFWPILHMELGAQRYGLRTVPRWIAAVAALPTLLPLIFMGVRWPSFEGELSAAGSAMTQALFRLLHTAFLVLAVITFFDFKYSPSARMHEVPIGFLTFYYMGALCVGYFSGYLLLVFGRGTSQPWYRPGTSLRLANKTIVGLVCLLAIAAPCLLCRQNISHMAAGRGLILGEFAAQIIRDLPAKPTLVLSDQAERLELIEAAYARVRQVNPHILIDTTCLAHREYIQYLLTKYPVLKKVMTPPEKLRRVLPSLSLVEFLYDVRTKYPIYYLHPSFGYYFEAFYPRPHGLVYEMLPYPKDSFEAPSPSLAEIRSNEEFWTKLEKDILPTVAEKAKLNQDVNAVAVDYSLDLNFWAVVLQKAGHLAEAGAQFAEATVLNPYNFLASINLEYNKHLRNNDHHPIDTGDLLYKARSLYGGLVPILQVNGPVDEPELDLQFGSVFAQGGNLRQAAAMFERCLQLLPGEPRAELALAKTYVDLHQPDKAMELIRQLPASSAVTAWEISRVQALAYLSKNDFIDAERVLLNGVKENPNDENRVAVLAEFYRATGNSAMRLKNKVEARSRLTMALHYINKELELLQGSGHTTANTFDVADTLMMKAEVEMMLQDYAAGIKSFDQIVPLQPSNPTVYLNRAIAEVQVNKLQAAKDDYKTLRKLMPPSQSYVIDSGLAEIAAREKNNAERLRYLKRYLKAAPDDTPEYQWVQGEVKKLEGH